MHVRTPRGGRRLVAAAATLGLLGMPLLASPAEAGPGKDKPPAIKVMTRNVYLGADIMRPIKAIATADQSNPIAVLDAFANANDTTRDNVDKTDFATRARLLASEIAAGKPDLVGLQEVALWRHGPMDDPLGDDFVVPNATEEDFDFLAMLLGEINGQLEAQGITYEAVSVNTLSDVEGPAYEGSYFSSTNNRDVRLTMHDVILMRSDSRASIVKKSKGKKTYETNMPPVTVNTPTGPKSIEFERGYQWLTLAIGDRRFRFVNTHLEAFSSDVAFAQAKELMNGPGSFKGTTIVVCDCNSDPLNGTVKEDLGDTKKHWSPYRFITRKAGFSDEWLEWAPAEEGWTSGLSELVDDVDGSGFDHRIDMVFGRSSTGKALPARSGVVTGDEVTDRDEDTGLWPSDHAGVLMKLRLR